jgi:hypothetical protein
MKDEYKWYNSVQFNNREKITENWPSEREAVSKDPKLKPFIGMNVGGKKQVSTVIPPPVCDNTGQSNLQDLLLHNSSNSHQIGQSSIGFNSQQSHPDYGQSNSQIRNLKGELVRSNPSQNQLITSNIN